MKRPILLLLLIIPLFTNAQIATDGTLGPALQLQGANYQIGANLGRQVGGNLFHSFQDFNLNSTESATFLGPNHIQNVISRVTGGNPSNIDGLFRSTIPGADVYFLNPYGILFGPNARLDVQGSFHASTADSLNFKDGGRFDARNPGNSILTIAPIESFGFLTNSPAPLSVQGSQLEISEGKTFSLIGGNLSITGAQIKAPTGRINLASVAEIGDVIPKVEDFVVPSLHGDMIISENSLIETSGEGGGTIDIRSGQFVMDNSTIAINTLNSQASGKIDLKAEAISLMHGATISSHIEGSGIGADINLSATESITVAGENTDLKSSRLLAYAGRDENDTSNAGQISLKAKNIVFKDGAVILTEIRGSGQGSQVTLTADESVLFTGTGSQQEGFPTSIRMITRNQPENANKNGDLLITADNIAVKDYAYLYTSTDGQGKSSEIILNASDILIEEAWVISDTTNIADAGSITVEVDNELKLSQSSYIITLSVAAGNTGNINIQAKNILLNEGSYFMSLTHSTGKAGNIQVKAIDTVTITEADSQGWGSGIISDATPTVKDITGGNGGDITIKAGQLLMEEGGHISASSYSPLGLQAGLGGNIYIEVEGTIELIGANPHGENAEGFASGIYARSVGVRDNGAKGGNIRLQAKSLTITDGAAITSSTNNNAPGGTIDIVVQDTVTINGDASEIPLRKPGMSQLRYVEEYSPTLLNQSTSGIYASSKDNNEQAGPAGKITLVAKNLILTDKGTISTSSAGGGKAGNITLDVTQLQMDNTATIRSENQLLNTYQFADVAERDSHLVVQGDIIEVADIGNGKLGNYINLGANLIKIKSPVDSVANMTELHELPNQYELSDGQIIEVADIGNGQSAHFIYARHRRTRWETWQRMSDTVNTTLETSQPIYELDNTNYAPTEPSAYQLGERIRVRDMGDGKPADFIYTRIFDPVENRSYVRLLRVNQFNVTDRNALNALSEQVSLQNYPIATVANADNGIPNQFIYANQQWIPFNNSYQVANLSEMNALTLAKTGNIAEIANAKNGQPTQMIYTGQQWLSLNPGRRTVQTLTDLEQLPAKSGDLVKVMDAGNNQPENYFYVDGQWLKQERGGDAGTITMKADTIRLTGKAAITTEAISGGGGGITLNINNLVLLTDSNISTSVQEGAGNGGDLNLNPEFVILENGKIIARANEGHGGNINITTTGIYRFPPESNSPIDASSKLGIDGEVVVNSPDTDISGQLLVLSTDFVNAADQMQPPCSSRIAENLSSFVLVESEGISTSPDDLLPSGPHFSKVGPAKTTKSVKRKGTTAKPHPQMAYQAGCQPATEENRVMPEQLF
jgi:filamentous hemagglutinin family protein